jgi:chromate transporter
MPYLPLPQSGPFTKEDGEQVIDGQGQRVMIFRPWSRTARARRYSTMRERSAVEVLLAFLKLGLTSFGGPIAHLGYFREEIVVRRRWIDDPAYTDLVALCQFLPGPASSQVAFSLGLIRAGYRGALAAWVGFTFPSAVLMMTFALGAGSLTGPLGTGTLHGLKLVAVAIVAQAVWGMARTLCPDRTRACIAAIAAVLILSSSGSSSIQIVVILLGGLGGLWLCRSNSSVSAGILVAPVSRRVGVICLSTFIALLIGLPLVRADGPCPGVALFDAFYQSGALVFGGGHVVLPLLRNAVVAPGWVSDNVFLAGYGAAQAIPGPLFTFAAYLGAIVKPPPHGILGAALGLVAIFLPGTLVLLATLPFWNTFRSRRGAQAVMRGINAAVVGILGAALYSPVWVSSVHNAADVSVAIIGFLLLTALQAPPIVVVLMGAVVGIAMSASAS